MRHNTFKLPVARLPGQPVNTCKPDNAGQVTLCGSCLPCEQCDEPCEPMSHAIRSTIRSADHLTRDHPSGQPIALCGSPIRSADHPMRITLCGSPIRSPIRSPMNVVAAQPNPGWGGRRESNTRSSAPVGLFHTRSEKRELFLGAVSLTASELPKAKAYPVSLGRKRTRKVKTYGRHWVWSCP